MYYVLFVLKIPWCFRENRKFIKCIDIVNFVGFVLSLLVFLFTNTRNIIICFLSILLLSLFLVNCYVPCYAWNDFINENNALLFTNVFINIEISTSK